MNGIIRWRISVCTASAWIALVPLDWLLAVNYRRQRLVCWQPSFLRKSDVVFALER